MAAKKAAADALFKKWYHSAEQIISRKGDREVFVSFGH